MKKYLALLLTFLSFAAAAHPDSTAANGSMKHTTYEKNTITLTAALGIVDGYRHYYTLPPAFEKNNTTGFAPFYARLEYGLTNHISFGGTFTYDAFVCNFNQVYKGNNGTVLRYKSNNTRVISGALAGYYHFIHPFNTERLDLYIGLGLSINNIRYGAFPEGDSTRVKVEHTVLPVAKLGARYYINDVFSLYGDAGFDFQSICSVGVSCRFFRKQNGK